jgi:membrane fusion protein (multidrug efflux system)
MNNIPYINLFALGIVLTLYSCGGEKKDSGNKKGGKEVSVDVMIVSEGDVPGVIEVNGTVLSNEKIELHTEAAGKITFLNIPDGEHVTAGTILARINDADLQAELEQLKTELALAEKTEQRYRQLLAANGIDQATYDASLSAAESLKARINVKNAQIEKTIVRAPFNGRLGLRQVSIGAYITATTIIGTLQSEEVKIDFTVPENYESMAVKGNKISVSTANSETRLQATITAVEPQINTSTRNLKVRAHLDSGRISPGAFVKVTIEETNKGIMVPTHSVIPDALSNQLILVKQGKAVFTNIETGIRNATAVEITKGIMPGDTVVVNGVLFVRPNSILKVDKVLNLSDIIK